MMTDDLPKWKGALAPIEQPAGPPLVEPVDPAETAAHRKVAYESYEQFLRRSLEKLEAERPRLWQRDYGSIEAYLRSIEPMRDRLKRILGFWMEPNNRPPPRILQESPLLTTDYATITRLTFEVLPGLCSYAIRLRPRAPGPHTPLLAQHGYFSTPEEVVGLSPAANGKDGSYRSLGLRAARRGYHVIAPHHPDTYGTRNEGTPQPLPGHPEQNWHYGNNRLHRLCVLSGGSRFGLDLMISSRAIDLLLDEPDTDAPRVGMYGLSRGGEAALLLPALDTRIEASVCSAFFNCRLLKLIGPAKMVTYLDWFDEAQFLFDFVRWFSDADLVSLIAPRAFAVEAGIHEDACPIDYSQQEFARAQVHYERLGLSDRIEFIARPEGHVSATRRGFEFLDQHLKRNPVP